MIRGVLLGVRTFVALGWVERNRMKIEFQYNTVIHILVQCALRTMSLRRR